MASARCRVLLHCAAAWAAFTLEYVVLEKIKRADGGELRKRKQKSKKNGEDFLKMKEQDAENE